MNFSISELRAEALKICSATLNYSRSEAKGGVCMLLTPWYDVVTPRQDVCEGLGSEALEVYGQLRKSARWTDAWRIYKPGAFFRRNASLKWLNGTRGQSDSPLNCRAGTQAVFQVKTPVGGNRMP